MPCKYIPSLETFTVMYLFSLKYSNFNISNHGLLKRHGLETMFRCKFNTAV